MKSILFLLNRFSFCRRCGLLLLSFSFIAVAAAQEDPPPPPPPPPQEDVPFTKAGDEGDANFINNDYSFIYSDSLLLRRVPDSVVGSLQRQRDFWYANYDFSSNKEKKITASDDSLDRYRSQKKKSGKEFLRKGDTLSVNRDNNYIYEEPRHEKKGWLGRLSEQTWFSNLLWIIIIGGFLFALISYLINSDVGLFRKKNRRLADKGPDDGEMPENIFEIRYMSEIDKAAAQGNYRLAIRLMYLELLKNCAERNIIQYRQDRTNFDYLMQLSGSSKYKDFFRLTRHFEYAWYGQFAISADMYAIIKKEFSDFNSQLH